MSEIAQIQQLILNILGQDNVIRRQNEEVLNKFKKEQTDNFVLSMCQLLKESSDQAVRSFAAVTLRKNLSDFSEKNFENLYKNLTPESSSALKLSLFQAVEQEQVNSVRHQICDAIGEIGGSLLSSDSTNQWPELTNMVFQLLQGSENNVESGFKILASIFTYQSEIFMPHKATLYGLFVQALQSKNNHIKVASVQAFGSLIEVMEPKECKEFEELLPAILETTYNLLLEDETIGEDILQVLSDIAEAEPKFYRKHFLLLFQTMHKITWAQQIEDKGIKREATELLVALGERIPKLLKDNQNLINQLLEMIFFHMVDIEDDVTAEWSSPKEGFNEDLEEDSDLETVRFGMNAIDRLISSIGEQIMLPQLSQVVQIMLQHQDWRYRNAAIMALSQVGEYVADIEQIKPIILVVLGYCTNENPKIRYAVCHCIGQISDDMQPKFQENFHQEVLPKLCQLMQDPIPRVVSHAAAAITNFVEGMPSQDLDIYLRELLIKCFELLQNSISIVKENIVSVIAAAAEAAGENFKPYFNDAAKILFNIMQTHNTKEYKQLRGQLIEAITLAAYSVGYELFQPFQDTLIQFMIQIQESNLEQIDPQKTYLLSGWQRLCMIMKENFKPYLQQVIPSLLRLISNIFNEKSDAQLQQEAIQSQTQEGEAKNEHYNTYDTEEAEIAINMIAVIIDEMKESYVEFVDSTSQIIIPLVNYNTNDSIRKAAANCLPSLISSMKTKDVQSAINATKVFLGILINAANSEYSSAIIIDQIHAMKDCIEEVDGKFMNSDEINDFSQKILQLLMASDKRKAENEKFKKEDELEEDEIELIDEDNDTEEELHVAIAELMGSLFKTHKELTLPLVDLLYNQILSKVLDPALSDKMHKFGLFLIDDMIEYLGIELIQDKWGALSEALIRYATDKTCFVRQAAVYGIGILAEKSSQAFQNMNEICLKTLDTALQIPKGNEKEKVYGYCKDNTIAAFGKIIKNHANTIPNLQNVIQHWLNNLPLRHDKPEAHKQHELLIDIVLNKPELVFGQNGTNIPHIIKIYGEILDTKLSTPEIKTKIKQSLETFKSDQVVVANWSQITAGLTQLQKQRLEACINA